MVNLAMGYSNEKPMVVGELIVKADFSNCGPYHGQTRLQGVVNGCDCL